MWRKQIKSVYIILALLGATNMKADKIILQEGMNVLINKLGIVDAEKFISLILKENFNYTQWQNQLWNTKTIEEIHNEAENFFDTNNKSR